MIALIVDDSAAMRRIQQMTLEAQSWKVETAANAEEALTKLRTLERCDLMITDWHMPGMEVSIWCGQSGPMPAWLVCAS